MKTGHLTNNSNVKMPTIKTPVICVTVLLLALTSPGLHAASRSEMRQQARAALNRLYADHPGVRNLGEAAKGILVFPKIVKAGFVVGGQQGDGTLFVHGNASAYYKSIAASYGLQAGIQKFGYALFFMTDHDLAYLRKSGGWEIGSGPSIVVVDTGMAKNMTTTTLRKGVYAFVFAQRGLMAGLGLQGTKITQIHPD